VTIFAYYTSPTTPGATSWSEDVSGAIRLASITGLVAEAEAGAVGAGNIVLDDPTSSIGHSGDGIVGLKQFHMIETDAPPGNQRLYTGYIGDRRYYRGKSNSLITGAARVIDATLYDINSFLSFRVFPPHAIDASNSFVRPAETDLARVAALLTAVGFLSDTLYDIGYIPTTGGIAMDANDYTGSHPGDVLNGCAQASGRNYFVLYDEATGKYVLWYDVWTTDGTSTIVYDSPLSLTNVLSEASATAAIVLTAYPGDTEVTLAWTVIPTATVFPIEPDAVETIDPSRVVSACYLPYTGGEAYETRPATAYKFAWRDTVAPSVTVKTLAKANALANRYLADNATEDNRIALTVQLPSSAVTLLREGMRVQLHATHLPNVDAGFTWCRVLQRTIRQDQETPAFYWVDLELSVPPNASGFHQLVLSGQIGPAVHANGTYQAVWAGDGGAVSLPTPAIVQDTDGYTGVVGDLQSVASVTTWTIPPGLGGTYNVGWEMINDNNAWWIIGDPHSPQQVPYIYGGVDDGCGAEICTPPASATFSFRANGVAVVSEVVNVPGSGFVGTDFAHHHVPSSVVLNDGDVLDFAISFAGNNYFNAIGAAYGNTAFGAQQGVFVMTKV
jgi:hypothetical protein